MDQFFDTMRKEKRTTYMIQIRKENTEKIFTMKRLSLLKMGDPETTSSMKHVIEDNINVKL